MRRTLPALIAAFALLTACSDDASTSVVSSADNSTTVAGTDTTGTTATPVGGLEWDDFGDDGSVQISSIDVPIDYNDPSKGTFNLYLARHLADPAKRIGSLLVNPGGPGFGGSDFAIYAEQVYNSPLLEAFDIIGWDPRGTGLSEPAIDCIDDYDAYYASLDITPDDEAERTAIADSAEQFAGECVANNADILQYIGTNNSARDMDSIRAALGEEKISYFGFSYGSELGATWATLFPDTVRAAVLDGAADPTADFIESGLQQSVGFEATLATFLAQCSDDDGCAFHHDGDAEGAFDALMLSLDESPVPSEDGRPDVNRQVAVTAAIQAMYTDALWGELADALAAAEEGDGRGLLALYDNYYERGPDGSYPNSLEAFQSIYCMDTVERLSIEEEDATAPEFLAAAPRISPGTTGSYFCTFFPTAQDPRVTITGAGAGPILVMGTTGDAATPLAGTRTMADTLEDGRLVVVDADQHTGYSVNRCSGDVIDQYLLDPVNNAPADETEC
ncbi:MAG: alpha/beta hydrolase [Ilumatobacteraceae bacterium]